MGFIETQTDRNLTQELERRKQLGEYRTLGYSYPSSGQSLPQLRVVDFHSNDYLGLAHNQELSGRVLDHLHTLNPTVARPNGSTGSRLLSGNSEYIETVEENLKQFFKVDGALVFNSGFNLNQGLFSTLLKEGDVAIYDEWVHASIRDGVRLSKCHGFAFRHNDLSHLERRLQATSLGKSFQGKEEQETQESHQRKIVVIVESLYSMDGDFAPLKSIVELCQKFKALCIVDEAHSAGVFGDGRGWAQELGVASQLYARVVPLGKAFGSSGAVFLGSAVLRDYLINFSKTFVYTTALPLYVYVLIDQALKVIAGPEGDHLRERLKENMAYFQQLSQPLRYFNKLKSHEQSPIINLSYSGERERLQILRKLEQENIFVNLIRSPTVKRGTERLRLCLHAFNTREEIQRVSEILQSELREK